MHACAYPHLEEFLESVMNEPTSQEPQQQSLFLIAIWLIIVELLTLPPVEYLLVIIHYLKVYGDEN